MGNSRGTLLLARRLHQRITPGNVRRKKKTWCWCCEVLKGWGWRHKNQRKLCEWLVYFSRNIFIDVHGICYFNHPCYLMLSTCSTQICLSHRPAHRIPPQNYENLGSKIRKPRKKKNGAVDRAENTGFRFPSLPFRPWQLMAILYFYTILYDHVSLGWVCAQFICKVQFK